MSYSGENYSYGFGAQQRRLGPWLAIGILVLPVMFTWLLLRAGYSIGVRVIGFAWLVVWAVVSAIGSIGSAGEAQPLPTRPPAPAAIASIKSAQPLKEVETEAERRADEINRRIDASLPGVQQAMNDVLKDPSSARYRDVWAIQPAGTKGIVFCGEVNAQNSLGGYNGFERFFGVGHRVWIRDNSDGFFDQLYSEACDEGLRLTPVTFK